MLYFCSIETFVKKIYHSKIINRGTCYAKSFKLAALRYLLTIFKLKQSSDTPHERKHKQFFQMARIDLFWGILARNQTFKNVHGLNDVVTLKYLYEKKINK